ncbi:MAG: hypothetical protein R3A80_08505 [Bdellovibrionota bacterium]
MQTLTAASLHDFSFDGKKLEGASGRGVGGGVEDAPICEIVKSIGRSLSQYAEEDKDSEYDADRILDIINKNRIHVAPDSFFTDKSSTYTINNGDIYLNSIYWNTRIHEEGYEDEIIIILLDATEQKDFSDNVTEHYGDRIRRNDLPVYTESFYVFREFVSLNCIDPQGQGFY